MKHLITLLTLINFSLLGQDLSSVDKKVAEIERYKKYETVRFDSTDLASVSKDLIETIQYNRKNSGLHKIEIREKIENGFCFRTYYFDKENLISIREKKYNGETILVLMNYYFVDNEFVKALDSKGIDKTNMIDKKELTDRIRKIFALHTE